ncbi:hypothetical protein [Deinococcus sp.]|uniref:hypothetical protein n=1 Tax=Deinococcus sp. TaxID=47478 RepID=UPI00286E6340|nr:hypothetical protein [Deinococcus sp.]
MLPAYLLSLSSVGPLAFVFQMGQPRFKVSLGQGYWVWVLALRPDSLTSTHSSPTAAATMNAKTKHRIRISAIPRLGMIPAHPVQARTRGRENESRNLDRRLTPSNLGA